MDPTDSTDATDTKATALTGAAVFRPIAPGRPLRWGGAGVVVARREDLRRAPLLSPAEQQVADGLAPRRRAEWLAGRLLAKSLVATFLAAPAHDVEVLPRADGSPRVLVGGEPMPALHLSLSHTARHVAAALAPGPVGVDLCDTASAAMVRRVADHVLSPRDRRAIAAGPPHDPPGARPAAWAGAWALKEAAVKADRSGIFGPAARRVPILGLWPPLLGGGRRAAVWQTEGTALALVLARPARDAGVP
ncbi:4'-phosphopantetheinyl transferase family protein [Streptomyces sp. NPDC059917]|uniref:4'-phosphopantetheinyl transferase family protein n=1 Tax=Streptomyces sp. NPDC059917 TaxID=3347002 RepID=UPI003658EE78